MERILDTFISLFFVVIVMSMLYVMIESAQRIGWKKVNHNTSIILTIISVLLVMLQESPGIPSLMFLVGSLLYLGFSMKFSYFMSDSNAELYNSVNINDSCHVYIMRNNRNGYSKIGISNKPEYREKTLQSEEPDVILLASKELPSRKLARAIEKALHETYSIRRVRGEWFDLNEKEMSDIMSSLN